MDLLIFGSLRYPAKHQFKFKLEYGNGHKVLGPGETDTDEFAKVLFDGIIGLAFPGLSHLSGDPFFVSAIKQDQLKDLENKFAFVFSTKPGVTSLTLGCIEDTAYKDKTEKHLLAEEDSHWELGEADLSILQLIALLSSFNMVIDIGAYKITGPPAAVDFLYKQIPDARQYVSPDLEAGNHYTFPCASIPSVSFHWHQDNYWSMSSDTVSLGPIKEDPSCCLGSIIGLDMTKTLGENTWILGEMFLRNVYTVFSMDDPSNKKPENRLKLYVGFAELK
ncbi:hypothetical protein Clacol_010468 [Clathrus columnatus]|uniref:Peptidase A1 domain-containing protein n=1 Tax=Clathrus columnatus TaxID=1419009 RepID=A0AAV5ARM8_9AGAM|nr:hypothetical protein Clacol_010468 [Clathrus columnatus]